MKRHRRNKFRLGIGLTDLMVGLAISLLAMLVILKVAILFEARRKSTIGAVDAQLNAASAITLLARDIRRAGQGLGPPDSLGCVVEHELGTSLDALSVQPVTIVKHADGKPDEIIVLSSASQQNTAAAALIANHKVSDSSMMLDTTLGIAPKDFLLLYEPGKPCTLVVANAISIGSYKLDHQAWQGLKTTGQSYLSGTAVINLGHLHYTRYFADAKAYLQKSSYSSTSNAWHNAAMSSDVVGLRAQYGFDMRPGAQASPQVTRWSSVMLDADGDGTSGNNGDLRRMIAIRLAVVARSAQRNDQGCNSPLPQWMAGDEETSELIATDIVLNHISNWSCYRYRVFQTEIPLRNLLWSDS